MQVGGLILHSTQYVLIFRGQVLTANQFAALVIAVCAVPLVYPLNYAVFIWPSAERILETEQVALANATCQDTGQVALYKETERVISFKPCC